MVLTRSKKEDIKSSIIIPTYKEASNLHELITRVYAALGTQTSTTEIVVVDDNSRDGSVEVINTLSKTFPLLRIILRTKERGLSSAVLHGFKEARGKLLLCMDADLQHPPESVPAMLKLLEVQQFVIGTRYGAGEFDVDAGWPLYRQIISQGARALAIPLTSLSDPMTGFFGIQKSIYEKGQNISPIGFKIAMELYVKCGIEKHGEVPIKFGVRTAGESKLSSKVIVNYLNHLLQLYHYKFPQAIFVVFLVLLLLAVLIILLVL